MDSEALVVCCSKTALMLAKDDPQVINSCVMTNLVPENDVYIVDKELFLEWLKLYGEKGEKS